MNIFTTDFFFSIIRIATPILFATLAAVISEKGGVPNFSQQMTVIGQIYSGMDVAEKLAQLETNDIGVYKFPKEDVLINSVTISTYSSEDEITEDTKNN